MSRVVGELKFLSSVCSLVILWDIEDLMNCHLNRDIFEISSTVQCEISRTFLPFFLLLVSVYLANFT